MRGLEHYLNATTALPAVLLELVRLRASLLNGCSFCVGHHTGELQKHNEPKTRIEALRDWVSSDAFTPRERAALAWTDAVTNIQGSHASDAEYAAVSVFFKDKELVDLTLAIAGINAWNRMSLAFAAQWDPFRGRKAEAQPAEAQPAEQGAGSSGSEGFPVPASNDSPAAKTVSDAGSAGNGTAGSPRQTTPAHEDAPTQDVVDDDGGKVAQD